MAPPNTHALPLGRCAICLLYTSVINIGVDTTDAVDYPDMAEQAAKVVLSGEAECGILICGTGIGIGISANKIKGIRAALCSDCYSARMSREHNDANFITCLLYTSRCV